ncbi:GNAT family N-acetyltransferase [Rhodocytophaga rosea]|uniref:GNAT family N-acetyltransferase n=1 Tax=Rhodocytophaga rosea TaxID=2704465 RepID=A0A6C0GS13_9BACT|nr:GNAT family N-acetyltransferase [Rhodocytophaga rosea]QHT70654.1 GNAT family N-acetyltransferase [Rhodocytophaga rosea]
MTHILDNPIWNALVTGNKHFASGNEQAKYIRRDVGPFAGLKTNSERELNELHALLQEKSFVVLFTPGKISIPAGWDIKLEKALLQMVYQPQYPPMAQDTELIALQDEHIPAMLELTAMTKPGPFYSRTIEFGNYEGIFQENTLVAMTGQRLQPDPYTEVSAVCTHPDHTGKGYAAKLISSQIHKITAVSRIPFLHVFTDNRAACKLYEKLGFRERKQMLVYMLEKA